MKKKIMVLALGGMIIFTGITVEGAEKAGTQSNTDMSGAVSQIKEQLSEAFENMDEETAGEGEFDVTIDEQDAQKLVETMEKLEDMGFSGEYIIEKAEDLYNEYGAEFAEHIDEVVVGAVKNAAANAANNFFQNTWGSIKSFFANLFN